MKKHRSKLTFVLLLAAALLIQGCAYSHTQRPLDMDFDRTTLGTKIGRSHSHSILWLVAWGDAGTRAAAEAGDIEVIHHADVAVTMLLFGVYTRVSTVVYGN